MKRSVRSLHALFKHGAKSNLTPHTGGNSRVIAHTHDVLNREASKSYSASADGLSAIANVYDFNWNVTQVTPAISSVLIAHKAESMQIRRMTMRS